MSWALTPTGLVVEVSAEDALDFEPIFFWSSYLYPNGPSEEEIQAVKKLAGMAEGDN